MTTRHTAVKTVCASVLGAVLCWSLPAGAAESHGANDMFIIKSSAKSPEATVAAIKNYVTDKKWLYLAEFKVKNNEVTLVKICVPAMSKGIWAAGLHVSAMGPCGNIGVYQEGGTTKISMLHPKFLDTLNPDPSLKKVGEELYPLFTAMLDDVTR